MTRLAIFCLLMQVYENFAKIPTALMWSARIWQG